ncbi:MAG: hypothetical protein HDT28_09310 [Clostridiales bacterium]|nr:hypothetical protein [Clostridiales bacterium]
MAKVEAVEYKDRESLDAELLSAVSDIMSAEEQAKSIIAVAAENVKAVQQAGSIRERDMRESSKKLMASAREEAFKEATDKAEAECARALKAAHEKGDALVKSKQKDIAKRIDELYKSLGSKK